MQSNSHVMKAVFVVSRPTASMMVLTRENVAKGQTEMSLWKRYMCECVLFDRNVCPVVPLRSLKNDVLRSSCVRLQFQGLRMTR